MGMNNVFEASTFWHDHCVDVDPTKKRSWSCYYWWDIDMLFLSGLTDVATVYEPPYIRVHERPPKALSKMAPCCKHASVSCFIVQLSEQLKSSVGCGYDFVLLLGVFAPKRSAFSEKLCSILYEAFEFDVYKIWRTF